MTTVVAGSIASDHLMHYPGRFTESLLPDQLHRVSLSFLVDDLIVRRGGSAANICFGMGLLGSRPVLLGSVGADFAEYRGWLDRHGVNCEFIKVCDDVQTARFVCTTDDEMNQIATFYAGAMARSEGVDIAPVIGVVGPADIVLIGAHDPEGMIRQADECRRLGYSFAADPSQQLARMDGKQAAALVDGAAVLCTNDYELGLLLAKTGWTDVDLKSAVGLRVTTLGKDGVEIVGGDGGHIRVPVVPEVAKVDPTGVGDGFRAGFLTGRERGLGDERSAQLGALIATLVLETAGGQQYTLDWHTAAPRLAQAYGAAAADEIVGALGVGELVG